MTSRSAWSRNLFSRGVIEVRRRSVERLELVSLDGRLVLVQVRQRILGTIMVGIVVCVYRLRLEPSDRVELLDGGRAEAREGTEHRALDFRDLRVLHRIHE